MSHFGSFLALGSHQTNCFRKAGSANQIVASCETQDEVIQSPNE